MTKLNVSQNGEARLAVLEGNVSNVEKQLHDLRTSQADGFAKINDRLQAMSEKTGFSVSHYAFMFSVAAGFASLLGWYTATSLDPIEKDIAEINSTLKRNVLDVMSYRIETIEKRLGITTQQAKTAQK